MVNVGADSKCNYYAAGRQRAGAAGAEAEAQREEVAKGVARVRGRGIVFAYVGLLLRQLLRHTLRA